MGLLRNRMPLRTSITLLLSLTAIPGCGERRDGPGITAGDGRGDGGLTKTLDIEGKSLLGEPPFEMPIGGAVASDGTLLVADGGSLSIRLFDASGDLIRSVGREGAGPGEFQSVPWARQCGVDSLFVWDPIAARVTVLGKEGQVSRQFRLPGNPALVECSRRGLFAVIMHPKDVRMPDPSGKGPRYSSPMLLVSAQGDTVAAVGEVPAYENRPMGKRTRVAVSESVVFVGTQDSAFVQIYSTTGVANGALPIGVAGRTTTPAIYEAAIDQMSMQLRVASEREAYKAFMLKIPMPGYLPPYFELFSDGAGGVRALTSLPGEGITRLDGVAGDGAPLPVWTMPGDVRIFEVGTDYVLGSYEDADGVLHVALYRTGDAAR